MSGEPLRAVLLAVGDELLGGTQADTNSLFLARELGALGFRVDAIEIVTDDEEAIAEAVQRALARAELVTVTGGLGPTLDDVTRHGVARAFGLALEESAAALADVRAWFDRRGVPMSETNRRQALFPLGATVLENRAGTAPGFRLERDGRAVVVLPGPPRELGVMWKEEVLPWLAARGSAAEPLAEQRFYLFGLAESAFAERSGDWMAREAEPRMGCTVREGVLTVTLRARTHAPASRASLASRAREFRARFAAHVFSETAWELEEVLGRELVAHGTSVSVAESCTGGLVLALLTRVPGISAVLGRGFVTYADAAKQELLGVPAELLQAHGAVSGEVAAAMAAGAARASGAELALAVTGIAGPDGGSAEKPVGLVWFATSLRGEVETHERRFPPTDRDSIRRWAARTALFLGWKRLVAGD